MSSFDIVLNCTATKYWSLYQCHTRVIILTVTQVTERQARITNLSALSTHCFGLMVDNTTDLLHSDSLVFQ